MKLTLLQRWYALKCSFGQHSFHVINRKIFDAQFVFSVCLHCSEVKTSYFGSKGANG